MVVEEAVERVVMERTHGEKTEKRRRRPREEKRRTKRQ
jgi:hypothetical protein